LLHVNNEQRVIDFFLTVTSRLKSYREFMDLHAPEMTPNFNSFDFIQPNENKLSDIIAFFLDPRENHQQKDVFLTSFLGMVNKNRMRLLDKSGDSIIPVDKQKIDDPESVKVVREKTTNSIDAAKRRIDIVVEFNGKNDRFVVGIENKPWAVDQEKQVTDYCTELRENKKYDGRFIFVYLSGDGSLPHEDSITPQYREDLERKGQYVTCSYSDISKWIRECKMMCLSDRVRVFLKDFESYINREFEGGGFMENNIIKQQALQNGENLEIVLMVSKQVEEIKIELLDKLKTQIKEKLTDEKSDFEFEWNVEYKKPNSSFSFGKRDWKTFLISFEADNAEMNGVGYGISRKEPEKSSQELLLEDFGPGDESNSEWWLWFKHYDEPYRSWKNHVEPWVDILNGEMAKKVINKAKELAETLEKAKKRLKIDL